MMSQQQELDLEEGDELERDNVKRNEIEKTSPKPGGGGGGPDHHDINDHHDDHAPITAGPCIQIHGHNQSHPPQIVVQTIKDDHDTGRPTGTDGSGSDEDVSKVNTVLGPDIVEGPLLLYMEDNSEKHFEVESKSSPSPNERPACPEEIICCSPEADFEVRKNLMSVLRSPSQSSSIGSLSTQISPSTCSPDFCGQDSVSISFDDSTDHNELLLCYPTFEELHKSYGFESPEIMMAKLNEVVQQKSVGSKKLGPGDVKSPVRASDSQDGNPAFTSPHILHGCPPQRTGPHRSQHWGQPPRRVHLMSVPSTRGTDKGSVVLQAKGTPHPGQGIYIPGQCFPRGAFRYRTPTGYIIRHSAPSQKFPSATCVSPHASPANISLNSSGEEGSKTTPEEVTPPFRVPYNTPESGLANNPRYPHINRVLNDSNIMAELEEKRKCSPRTLEDFAKYQSPFPAESLSSDCLIDTDEVVFRKSRTQIGRVIHNATERKRRARIKQASDKLRRVVPGLTSKADKATVFEYAVEYILFMKKILGTENDRQFLSQC